MGKLFRTVVVIAAALIVASGTMSAQDRKKVERRITVISVDDNGVRKDTTIIRADTLRFNGDSIIINARAGRRMVRGTGQGDRMIWIERDLNGDEDTTGIVRMRGMQNMQGMMQGMRSMRMASPGMGASEGINYHLSVDGVVVTIRAPKEKADQADQILEAAKKALMKE